MVFSYRVRIHETAGEPVLLNCSACGARGVPGFPRENSEVLHLLLVIPVLRIRNVYIRCSSCGADLHTALSLDELAVLSPQEFERLAHEEIGLVYKFLAICSVLLSWTVLFGLILGAIPLFACRKKRTWVKAVSLAGIFLSAGFLLVYGFAL